MSTGLTAVSWLISAHHRSHTCSHESPCALWMEVMASCVMLSSAHLWWRSPCLGNCTCNAVTPPSSSYGSWWGPGQTGVAQVTPPSPPLWTAGSLKKLNKTVSKTKSFSNINVHSTGSSAEFDRTTVQYVTYWSRSASCQSPASCTAALSGCTTHCSWGRNSSPEGIKVCISTAGDLFTIVYHNKSTVSLNLSS